MLGANVGTTLIVQLLSFDTSAVALLLLVSGVVAFKRGSRTLRKIWARIHRARPDVAVLHILLDSPRAPAEDARWSEKYLPPSPRTASTLLIGAVLTWAAHSSVATILLYYVPSLLELHYPNCCLRSGPGANLGSASTSPGRTGQR